MLIKKKYLFLFQLQFCGSSSACREKTRCTRMAPVPPFWDICQWQNFPGKLNTWPNTSSKRFFVLPFLQPKQNVQKSMLLHWCCPLRKLHSLVLYICFIGNKRVVVFNRELKEKFHNDETGWMIKKYPRHSTKTTNSIISSPISIHHWFTHDVYYSFSFFTFFRMFFFDSGRNYYCDSSIALSYSYPIDKPPLFI